MTLTLTVKYLPVCFNAFSVFRFVLLRVLRYILVGSNTVMRSYRDKRFVLSCLCIFQSQVYERLNIFEKIINSLKHALIWYPRSIEASQRYASFMKLVMSNDLMTSNVESRLTKTYQLYKQLKVTTDKTKYLSQSTGQNLNITRQIIFNNAKVAQSSSLDDDDIVVRELKYGKINYNFFSS